MSASNERILVTIEGGVADVRLNRPDKMNALDQAMFDALIETGEQLARLPDLRAVVLSGAGRAFCAGLDMGRMAGMLSDDAGASQHDSIGAGRLGQRTHGISNRLQYACMVWRELPVPVFAAVHGVAFGGGLQVALGADVRYVAPDARLSVMELKWGLVPDMAGMVLTRGLVRPDVLRELVYSARVLSGAEACELGLGTYLADEPRAAALAAAREAAQKNPDAIRAAKRLMAVAERGDHAAILQAESDEQDRLVGSPNQREAVLANLEKRAPRFTLAG
ncbi:MAG: crotonase/enoyl-CoA hydratase family protein [Cupriavidus sp.]|nr:crotonase/enoyl-CoA hydratase family protein [Cupriavidus sp.]